MNRNGPLYKQVDTDENEKKKSCGSFLTLILLSLLFVGVMALSFANLGINIAIYSAMSVDSTSSIDTDGGKPSPIPSPTETPTTSPPTYSPPPPFDVLKVMIEQIIADGLAEYKQTTEYQQWVELGRSKCRDDVGVSNLYDFSTYKKAELDAIIKFDVDGQSNIYFYPGFTGSFPASVLGPAAPYFIGNTLDEEAFVKDVSITSALGFTLNITMVDIDFGTDPRITLFLKNLRDRSYLIDSNGTRRNNYEKRRYMAGLSAKIMMNKFLPKIDLLVNNVFNKVTILKEPVLGAFDEGLIDFFLSTHIGDRPNGHPKFARSFFKNFSTIVSTWQVNEPNRNESILYNNANSQCIIQYFRDAAADIMRRGDTTTLMYYWIAAGMPVETAVSEAMHNWIAYRQFMHITDLVIEHSLNTTNLGAGPGQWRFSTKLYGNRSMFEIWALAKSEAEKVNIWREMMRTLLPNGAWFSRKPNGNLSAKVSFQRGIHLPGIIQGVALTMLATQASDPNLAPDVFNYARYNAFNVTLSSFVNTSSTIDNRKDYIMFNNSDTPDYIQEEMKRMTVSNVDGQTIAHAGEENMFPVYPLPLYAPFGLGWRNCAGQNMVTVYGVRFMDKFFRLKFRKDLSITSPMIPQAPLKSVPDNLFVDQVALKNMIN